MIDENIISLFTFEKVSITKKIFCCTKPDGLFQLDMFLSLGASIKRVFVDHRADYGKSMGSQVEANGL